MKLNETLELALLFGLFFAGTQFAVGAEEAEIVLFAPRAHVDFWLPEGIVVQTNPVTGLVFADSNDLPLYVFLCDREIESANDNDLLGNSKRETCARVQEKVARTLTSEHPKCVGKCLAEHPPVVNEVGAFQKGDWTSVQLDDGTYQWAYKGRPLYRYKHDDTPGYPYGADVGGVWSQATVSGSVFTPYRAQSKASAGMHPIAPTAPIALAPGVVAQKKPTGFVLSDFRGMTLYMLDQAALNQDKSSGHANVEQWRPLLAGSIATPIGDWSIIRASDSVAQWAYKGRALYTCAGDARPGDQNCATESSHVFRIADPSLNAKEQH